MSKQLERKIEITYRWWRQDGKDIRPAHKEDLEDSAMERVQEQMVKGITSGELNDHICSSSRDAGIDYRGSWEVKTL